MYINNKERKGFDVRREGKIIAQEDESKEDKRRKQQRKPPTKKDSGTLKVNDTDI